MLKIHHYIFYRLYKWNLRNFGKEDLPVLTALLQLSLLSLLNVITLFIAINSFFSLDSIQYLGKKYGVTLIAAALVLGFEFLIFYSNNRYQKIIEKYETQSPDVAQTNNNLAISYVALSFLVFFVFLII